MRRKRLALLLAAVLVVAVLGPAGCGPTNYELSANVLPIGGGSISPSGGIYEAETGVTLVATPAQGYRFDHWEGDATGISQMVTVQMTGDKTVSAHFVALCTLSAYANPGEGGTVSPSSGTYDCGTEVTLVAAPSDCYDFDHWGGDASGVEPSLTVTLDSDASIGAYFAKRVYSVSAEVEPFGSGTVEPGNATYECGTEVTLTADAAVGYTFDRWEGDVSSLLPAVSFVIDGNKTTTAYFHRVYSLTTFASPSKGGSVTPTSGVYEADAYVTLTAVARFPYVFISWTGLANNRDNPVKVAMISDRVVSAYFVEAVPYPEISITDRALTGQTVVVPWYLHAGDWVDGQVWVQENYIKARIMDPSGAVAQEIPQTRSSAFRFQAKLDGTYSLVIYETPGRTGTDYYSLKYTVYTARVS